MLSRKQIFDAITMDGILAVDGTGVQSIINRLMDLQQQLLQQTQCTALLPPTYAVNRVEVIDEAGRSYVNWNKKNSVEVQLQDESRTMKIFISRR